MKIRNIQHEFFGSVPNYVHGLAGSIGLKIESGLIGLEFESEQAAQDAVDKSLDNYTDDRNIQESFSFYPTF